MHISAGLTRKYRTAPVIFASAPKSAAAGSAVVVSVSEVRRKDVQAGAPCGVGFTWCFTLRVEAACAGATPPQHVAWLALGEGSYLTDEGKLLQVGSQNVTGSVATQVPFLGTLAQQEQLQAENSSLVVLTQVCDTVSSGCGGCQVGYDTVWCVVTCVVCGADADPDQGQPAVSLLGAAA